MFNRLSSTHRFCTNLMHTRFYAPRRHRIKPNAGISRQMNLLENDVQEIIEDPESLGDLETDFMNLHESHKQYEKETVKHKEQIRLWIIKNKYFKVKQPNFLTYAEKEQIKLLHSRDPQEWTIEKLSESFPADPETISKIIKAKWVASSKERITKHDESVIKNWNLYKSGKLTNLNDSLKRHIDKFTNRKIEDIQNIQYKWEPKPPLPTPKINEFSRLITSCKKYGQNEANKMIEDSEKHENQSSSEQHKDLNLHENRRQQQQQHPGEDETYLIDKVYDKRPMRFEEVKRIKNLPCNHQDESEIENWGDMMESNDNENQSELSKSTNYNPFREVQKYENHEISISEYDMKKYEVTTIKPRIHIPKKLWKRNATYKVEDCYYDYDGEFLYRVPGMTGKNVN